MAEQKTFKVTIANVVESLFSGPAFSVTLPGSEGEMTILPHHSALVSPLRAGAITIKVPTGENVTFEVRGGTMEVSNNTLTILL